MATIKETVRVGRLSGGDLLAWLEGAESYAGALLPSAVDGRPSWVADERVHTTIDADQLLEHGEHPLGVACSVIASMQPGDILCITSSSYLGPLIDVLRRGGLAVYSTQTEQGRHMTYIARG